MGIQIPGLDALIKRFGDEPRRIREELPKAVEYGLLLIEADAKRNLADHSDTNATARSISHTMDGIGTNEVVGRVGPNNGIVGLVIEVGRRAGATMPPPDALADWGSRHGFTTPGDLFVLARAIGRDGIPPRPYLVPAFEANRERIRARFRQVGVEMIARLAKG